jgi:hypothetical protein
VPAAAAGGVDPLPGGVGPAAEPAAAPGGFGQPQDAYAAQAAAAQDPAYAAQDPAYAAQDPAYAAQDPAYAAQDPAYADPRTGQAPSYSTGAAPVYPEEEPTQVLPPATGREQR